MGFPADSAHNQLTQSNVFFCFSAMIRTKSTIDKFADPSSLSTLSVEPPGEVTVTATLAASSSSPNKAGKSQL